MKLEINEKESLILRNLLNDYLLNDEKEMKLNDYVDNYMLFAKLVYISNHYGGSLEKGETILSIFNELIDDSLF